jgi:hypothetical protein
MGYLCEDPNDALQRRLMEDMDTCAHTHFGMLEKTGAIDAPAEPREPRELEPPRATLAPPPEAAATGITTTHVLLALAAVAAVVWFVHSRRKR